jgi:lipopolysaccharide/colanic/teichoic acid biosynthesis glycosyltransferase
MGGMSSFSFDNLSPSEPQDRSDANPHGVHAIRARETPTPFSAPLAGAAPASRTCSQASRWVLSANRRIVEGAIALTALIAVTPIILLAAAVVRLTSRGPVFFRQRRMGRNGREFTLYKIRSMRVAEGAGSSITVVGDARITPLGAFLRRYKIDELPQFWNVVRGDMGLVGPRPKLPHHEALHLDCRPGITGVATLAFRKEEEFLSGIPECELEAFYELFVKPAKARLDLDYMRTATWVSDVAVLGRTVMSCLFGSNESLAGPAEIVARYAAERAPTAKVVPIPASHPLRHRPVQPATLNSEV